MCAAELCHRADFVADVGTDHAYLPIYLCLSGRIRGAVASDINQGPVERARENIDKYSLGEKITVVRADGLYGIDAYSPDMIMILGMGGELIARIIGDAQYTRNENVRLCMQPMTHPEILREFLLSNGYSIIDEALAEEEKIYQLIVAKYTGRTESYTDAELLLGRLNAERGGEVFERLALHNVSILERRAAAKAGAGRDTSEERELIAQINELRRKS